MTDTPARERPGACDRVDATDPIETGTDSETSGATVAESTDVDAAVARIRDRAEAVREREVETALAKLDARGDLSAADREAVEAAADRLVARLVAVPERGLEAAASADSGDGETATDGGEERAAAVETALELFG